MRRQQLYTYLQVHNFLLNDSWPSVKINTWLELSQNNFLGYKNKSYILSEGNSFHYNLILKPYYVNITQGYYSVGTLITQQGGWCITLVTIIPQIFHTRQTLPLPCGRIENKIFLDTSLFFNPFLFISFNNSEIFFLIKYDFS